MLLDYQKTHAEYILNNIGPGITLDISEPGTGKTYVACYVAKRLGGAHIIAPNNCLGFWFNVAREWGVNITLASYDLAKSGKCYDSSMRICRMQKTGLIIFDEIHMCKNDSGYRRLLDTSVPILGLSATLTDKKMFMRPRAVSAMKLVNEHSNEVQMASPRDVKINWSITQILRRRQRLELEKVAQMAEYARGANSVVIFCNFNKTIYALAEALEDMNPLIVHGSTKDNPRTIDEFQKGGRVLIINVKSGGNSINLQDTSGKHPRTAIINLMWSGTLFYQTLGRTYRVNSKSPVKQIVLSSDDLLDQYMLFVLSKKIESIESLNKWMLNDSL